MSIGLASVEATQRINQGMLPLQNEKDQSYQFFNSMVYSKESGTKIFRNVTPFLLILTLSFLALITNIARGSCNVSFHPFYCC